MEGTGKRGRRKEGTEEERDGRKKERREERKGKKKFVHVIPLHGEECSRPGVNFC
jgi:hypothetical protein